jgi:sirohydrochlorin cobaltochelatase
MGQTGTPKDNSGMGASEMPHSGGGLSARPGNRAKKKAILLVAFGTSAPEARKAFDEIERQVGIAYPAVEVRWAYTSGVIRGKLGKLGIHFDSPETALARMMDDGYTHVAVLSLHVIPGLEFHGLYRNAGLFRQMAGGFKRISVARPLISSHEDMARVAGALIEVMPAGRKPDEAVLFMGHGSKNHPADAVYSAMNYVLQELDANVAVATVAGYPTLDDVMPKLAEKQIRRVYLMPLMAVAGEHVRKDMAGEGPDSWKSILKRNGFETQEALKGMCEYPGIVAVWLDHLADAFSQL